MKIWVKRRACRLQSLIPVMIASESFYYNAGFLTNVQSPVCTPGANSAHIQDYAFL